MTHNDQEKVAFSIFIQYDASAEGEWYGDPYHSEYQMLSLKNIEIDALFMPM